MSKIQHFFLVSFFILLGSAAWAQNVSDFVVELTSDQKGVIITGYTGTVQDVVIPSTIEGFPVRLIRSMNSGTFRSVTIPDTVTTIGEGAFARTKRNTAYIGSMPTANMVSITIPDSVKIIGKDAFMGNTNLISVILPNDIKVIPEGCFYQCYALNFVILPSNVTSIGMEAFRDCSSLSSLDIPSSIKTIGQSAFAGTGFESFTIPENVTDIPVQAFMDCKKLKSVVFNKKIQNIGTNAFYGCTELVSITIPDNISTINGVSTAFSGLKKLNLTTQSRLNGLTRNAEEKQREDARLATEEQLKKQQAERSEIVRKARQEREAERRWEQQRKEESGKKLREGLLGSLTYLDKNKKNFKDLYLGELQIIIGTYQLSKLYGVPTDQEIEQAISKSIKSLDKNQKSTLEQAVERQVSAEQRRMADDQKESEQREAEQRQAEDLWIAEQRLPSGNK
jgi:hypothetical protein